MNSKRITLLMFFIFLFSACASNSQSRSEIFVWAKLITDLEKILESEILEAQSLMETIKLRPPNDYEYQQLVDYSDRFANLYNEIITIEPPEEARSAHNKFSERYAKTADYMRYYVLAIQMNDLNYFDKSVLAVQDANRIGEEANYQFKQLLEKYSISCDELDYCQ